MIPEPGFAEILSMQLVLAKENFLLLQSNAMQIHAKESTMQLLAMGYVLEVLCAAVLARLFVGQMALAILVVAEVITTLMVHRDVEAVNIVAAIVHRFVATNLKYAASSPIAMDSKRMAAHFVPRGIMPVAVALCNVPPPFYAQTTIVMASMALVKKRNILVVVAKILLRPRPPCPPKLLLQCLHRLLILVLNGPIALLISVLLPVRM